MPTIRPSSVVVAASLALAACHDTTMPLAEDAPCAAATRDESSGRVRLTLGPGQLCAIRGEDASSVVLAPVVGASEYLVVVQSVSKTPSARTSLELAIDVPGASSARVAAATSSPRPSAARAADPRAGRPSPRAEAEERASRAELTFRANARQALRNARPVRARGLVGVPPPGARLDAVARRASRPGDTVVLRNTVDASLGVDCDATEEIVTVVRALGEGIGILEDVEAAGPVTDADYAAALAVLESVVFPVDTTYFGAPADLDENGVVWVLFSPIVNRVTPRGSVTRVAGFFNPSDLSDPEDCAGSNVGEILYVLAADPDGRFSDPIEAVFATTRAIGVTAHELTHLISAQRRVSLGGGSFARLEDAWLGEALAHAAETAVGFRSGGFAPGTELGFDALNGDPDAFAAFYYPNFRRAGFHLLDPSDTPALGDASGNDPGGVPSLEMRGFGWLLTRWLVDHYAPPGAGLLGGRREEDVFRDLASGGPDHTTGTENLARVAASIGAPPSWEALLEAYALSPIAEDRPGDLADGVGYTSFALREAFEGLNRDMGDVDPFRSPYPLERTEVSLGEGTASATSFDLRASTGRFFLLTGGPHPEVELSLRTSAGAPLPSSSPARLVVGRGR